MHNLGKKKETYQEVILERMKADYFRLNNRIKLCTSEKQLKLFEGVIDIFFNNHFQSGGKNKELQQYYAFLLRAISEKKAELNAIQEITA
jgi:hypothetical protein